MGGEEEKGFLSQWKGRPAPVVMTLAGAVTHSSSRDYTRRRIEDVRIRLTAGELVLSSGRGLSSMRSAHYDWLGIYSAWRPCPPRTRCQIQQPSGRHPEGFEPATLC